MAGETSIEWTATRNPDGTVTPGSSWNPVTGCTKISPGCDHCYAETFAERFRGVPGHPYEQGFDVKLWPHRLELPLCWKKPRKIFVNSMSDWCLDEIPDAFVLGMFRTMLIANWHIYQLLTKRAPRMLRLVPQMTDLIEKITGSREWPAHIWLGVTVEGWAQRGRIEKLRQVPAAVRFLSYEPALSPLAGADLSGIHWLICGSESGHGARPMDETWARDIKNQCVQEGVAFFLKQYATSTGKKIPLPELDGHTWEQMPTLPARS